MSTLYTVIGQTLNQADISLELSKCGRGNITSCPVVVSLRPLYSIPVFTTFVGHTSYYQSFETRLRTALPIQICVVDPTIAETKAKYLCSIRIPWWQKMRFRKYVSFQTSGTFFHVTANPRTFTRCVTLSQCMRKATVYRWPPSLITLASLPSAYSQSIPRKLFREWQESFIIRGLKTFDS